jgi:outer membrane protein assembly factor BamB
MIVSLLVPMVKVLPTSETSFDEFTEQNPNPWPMFRHDLNHTGRSPYDTSDNDGQLKWKLETGDKISFSSPAIASDGTVYIGSQDGYLYAVYPNGTLKWRFGTGDDIASSAAIGSDGVVYFGSIDKHVYALNPNGTLKWKFQALRKLCSSPAVSPDGTVFIGSHDKNLYAIKPDGSLKWIFATDAMVLSSPAVGSDGTVYVGTHHWLYAINPDGTLKWVSQVDELIIWSSVAIGEDGTLYIGTYDDQISQWGYLYAFDSNGTLRWKFRLPGSGTHSSPAIGVDGTIYIGATDYSYNFFAVNPDGTQKWNFSANSYVHSSPAIGSDGTIFFGSEDQNVYALHPNGSLRWRSATGGGVTSSPAIGPDGTVYVGTADDRSLYALGEAKGGPVADAGPDQTVHEGDVVQFDGSGDAAEERKWTAGQNIKVTNSTRFSPGCVYGCTIDSVTSQDGTVHVVWREDPIPDPLTPSRIYYAFSNDSLTFSESYSILPEGWAGAHVALAVDSLGRIHIALDGGPPGGPLSVSDVYYTFSEDAGLSFADPVHIGEGADPDIALDGSGHIHIVFGNTESAKSWGVYWSISTGPLAFSQPRLLSIDYDIDWGEALIPVLAVDPSHVIHVAWMERIPYGGTISAYQIWYSRSTDNGTNFERRIVVNRSDRGAQNIQVVVDSKGNPHILWHLVKGSPDDNCSLGYIDSTNGGVDFLPEGFFPYEELKCPMMCYSTHLGTTIDPRNRIHAVVVAYPANGTRRETGVYHFVRNEDGTFSQIIRVNDDSTGHRRDAPSVSTLSPNSVDVFWRDNRYYEDIYYANVSLTNGRNLSFSWDMNDGIDTNGDGNYTNDMDAIGPSPTWIYGDDGVHTVTLKVTDDLKNWGTDTLNVTVLNVLPEVTANYTCNGSGTTDILLRIAGEKWHDVTFAVYEDGNEVYNETVLRIPGSPNEQMATLVDVSIDFSRTYSAVAYYTPEDDPVNGQIWGATPAWVIIDYEDGSKWIHHIFNVRHKDTWTWVIDDLSPYFLGHNITFVATASDPGSDDLTFTWDWGDGNTTENVYYNDGIGPDPYPSPEVNPITVTDTVRHGYGLAGTYVITLTVTDDDGGVTSYSFNLTL